MLFLVNYGLNVLNNPYCLQSHCWYSVCWSDCFFVKVQWAIIRRGSLGLFKNSVRPSVLGSQLSPLSSIALSGWCTLSLVIQLLKVSVWTTLLTSYISTEFQIIKYNHYCKTTLFTMILYMYVWCVCYLQMRAWGPDTSCPGACEQVPTVHTTKIHVKVIAKGGQKPFP